MNHADGQSHAAARGGGLKPIRWRLEYLLARLGLALLPRLPRPALRALARVTAAVAFRLAGNLRRIALANLDIAFGATRVPAEKKALARQAFRTMALVLLDFFWFSRRTAERIRAHVTLDDSIAVHFAARPFIGVTAHFGNWELLSRALADRGYDHVAVAAPLANPLVEPLFARFRDWPGVAIVRRAGAMRGLLKALRARRSVALLLDQNTKPDEGGLFVPLFGLPVPISSSAARLAAHTGAPLAMAFCRLQPNGDYRLFARPPPAAASTDVEALTRAIAAAFEEEIRAHPEQWLWMYKRWKHIPPGQTRAAYPFYAKDLP